jgi:phosphatidylserine/phosphatidylglycerophosphate/cardiolipin synthase-like enzyme
MSLQTSSQRKARTKTALKIHPYPQLLGVLLVLGLLPAGSAQAREHHRVAGDLEEAIADQMTKAPEDLEVCFSPDERCDRKIVKFVASAQSSLDIAIYDVNLGSLVDLIIEKSKTIPVRMVVDRRQAKEKASAVPRLIAAGVNIRYGKQRGSGIMHNKFVLVDGKMVETGSFNETNHASFYNNENQIYLANPKIVERYRKRFETLWDNGLKPRSN